MPTYSINPIPYNNIHLRSGIVVDPLVIEDVPSSVSKERMNQKYLAHTIVPIIEDA